MIPPPRSGCFGAGTPGDGISGTTIGQSRSSGYFYAQHSFTGSFTGVSSAYARSGAVKFAATRNDVARYVVLLMSHPCQRPCPELYCPEELNSLETNDQRLAIIVRQIQAVVTDRTKSIWKMAFPVCATRLRTSIP